MNWGELKFEFEISGCEEKSMDRRAGVNSDNAIVHK